MDSAINNSPGTFTGISIVLAWLIDSTLQKRAKLNVSFLCPSQLDAVQFRQLFQRFRKPSMRVF